MESQRRAALYRLWVLIGAALAMAATARAQFLQTGFGPYDYNTPANWTGGNINGQLTQSITSTFTQQITFGANTTITPSLNISLGGSNPNAILLSNGTGPYVLTLAGNVTMGGLTTSNVSIGSAAAGSQLNLELGGNRTFAINAGVLTLINGVTGTGSSSLIKTGAGTLVLTGTNSYTGGTLVSGGVFQVGNGNTTGVLSGDVTLASGAIAFVRNNTATYSGVISGTGTFIQDGITSGTLVLTGNNTYSGSTSINNGVLQLGAGGTSGAIGGNVSNNGVLVFNRSDNTTFGGVISGTGSVVMNTTGGLNLTAANTYTGGTIQNAGALRLDNATGSALGTGNVTVNGGTLYIGNFGTGGALTANIILANTNTTSPAVADFAHSGPYTYSGSISGSGSVVAEGGSVLTFAGTNTYSGQTSIFANSVLADAAAGVFSPASVVNFNGANAALYANFDETIGGLSSGGTGAVTITSGTALTLNNTANYTFGGSINGAGKLVKSGTGSQTLAGDSSYSGGTLVSGGLLIAANVGTGSATSMGVVTVSSGATLQVGAGGTVGTVAGNITDNGSVVFNRSDFVTYAGVISGAGSVTVTGGGSLTLIGNNTFTGGLNVLTGSVTIGAGSTSGSILSDVNLGAFSTSINFNRSDTSTYAGRITGSGNLQVFGGGLLALTNTSSYTGPTSIQGSTVVVGTTNALPATTNLSLGNNAATLQVDNNQTVGALSGNGVVAIAPSKVFTVNNTVGSPFFGTISGSGSLVKSGSGTLTLSNFTGNSYSGGTTVSGGTLIVNTSTGSGTGTGTVTVNSGTTLQIGTGTNSGFVSGNINDNGTVIFNRADDVTYSSSLGGTGSFTKSGAGTLTLASLSSFGGNFLVGGGTLALNGFSLLQTTTVSSGANLAVNASLQVSRLLGSGMVTISSGKSLTLNPGPGATSQFDGVITGAGALQTSGSTPSTIILTGNNTYTGGTTIGSQPLQLGNGGTSGSILGNVTNNGSLVVNRSDASALGGVISGGGSVTVTGGGVLTLGGVNTYTGGTTIAGGTVVVNNASGSGTGTGTVTVSSTGSLQVGTGTNSGSVGGNIVDNGSVFFNRADTATYSGVISGSGSVAQLGTGTLFLGGSSTYTGATTITNGTLVIGTTNALPTGSALTINDGATLSVANNQTIGSISGFGTTAALMIAAGQTFTQNSSSIGVFDGVISGAGSLGLAGGGILSLGNANTYTGGTTINSGVLVVRNATGSGTGTGDITINGGSLIIGSGNQITNSGGTTGQVTGNIVDNGGVLFNRANSLSYAGAISGTGSVTISGGGAITLAGNNTFTGGLNVQTGSVTIGNGGTTGSILSNVSLPTASTSIAFSRSDTSTYGGVISGVGALTLQGTGALVLTGQNTYTGGTFVNQGTLVIGANNALPSASLSLSGPATLSVANNQTIERLNAPNSSSAIVIGAGKTFAITPSATLTGGGNFAGTLTNAGTFEVGGANNTVPFTFTGTYSGATGSSVLVDAGGKLQIGQGGTAGDVGNANITNNGILFVHRSDNISYSGVISGTGIFSLGVGGPVVTPAGTLLLNNQSIYSGGTMINSGTLALGVTNALPTGTAVSITNSGVLAVNSDQTIGGLLGGGGVTLSSGKSLTVNNNLFFSYAGLLSGNGSLVKTGTSSFELTGNNTYTGGTTIGGGTLRLGNGGTTGTISGNVALTSTTSTIEFNRGDDVTYSGVISGTGGLSGTAALLKNGTGSLTLLGANTYTGQTAVQTGTLVLGADNVIASSAFLFINNGASAQAQGNEAVNVLTGGGNLSIAAGKTFSITGNGSSTFSGVISGGGALAQSGGLFSTLSLTGNNTYSGGTLITNGTIIAANTTGSATGLGVVTLSSSTPNTAFLQIGAGGTAGSVAGNIVNNGGTVRFSRLDLFSAPYVYGGVISGSGGVSLFSGGVALTGNNTYTGATVINSGSMLQVGTGGGTGAVAGNIVNNGALTFFRNDTLTTPYVYGSSISGGGSVTLSGSGSVAYTGANTYTGATTINGGLLEIGQGGTSGSIAGNVSAVSGALEFFRSDSLTYGGVLSGAGGLIQFGTGTTFLTGTNSFTGQTRVTNGTLALVADNAIANSSTVSLSLGASLDVRGNQFVSALNGSGNVALALGKTLTVSASTGSTANILSGAISGGGALVKTGGSPFVLAGANTYTGGTTVLDGQFQIGSGSTSGSIVGNVALANGAASLVFNRADNLTYGGVISGAGSLQKTGTGALTLTGNSTNTGATTVNQGTLVIGAANALSTGSATIVQPGATLDVAANQTVLNLNSNGTNSAVVLRPGTTLTVANSTVSLVNGVISGAGSLAKTGSFNLILTGDNTYTGGTTIAGGAVQIGSAGGTTGSIVGNVSVASGSALVFSRSDSTSFSGVISGAGGLQKNSTGSLTLLNTNLYTGITSINSGLVVVGITNALPILSSLSLNGSIGAASGLLVSQDQTVGGLFGNGVGTVTITNGRQFTVDSAATTTYGGQITGAGALVKSGSGTLVLFGNTDYTGGTVINGGMIQFNGSGPGGGSITNNASLMVNLSGTNTNAPTQVISGTGNLVVGGSGTVNFTAANTYAGGTTLNGGNILLNNTTGSALGTGPVTVNSGAVLGGSGTASGTVLLNAGAIISPGNSPGKINLGPTTLGAGSVFQFEINDANGVAGTNWDVINVNGTLAITSSSASPFAISLVSLNPGNGLGPLTNFNDSQNYYWPFATASAGITGLTTNNFSFQFFNFQNAFTGTFGVVQSGTVLALTFTPVPEPATWASLLAGGVMTVLWLRRRRK